MALMMVRMTIMKDNGDNNDIYFYVDDDTNDTNDHHNDDDDMKRWSPPEIVGCMSLYLCQLKVDMWNVMQRHPHIIG